MGLRPIEVEFAGQRYQAEADIEYFNSKELTQKALKALGVCWGTAILTIPIPVIHLVIPPLAILAGPFAAILVYLKAKKLPRKIDGTTVCAHCKAETDFLFRNAAPPYYEQCTQCKTGYQVIWPPPDPA